MREETPVPGMMAIVFIVTLGFLCVVPSMASERQYPVLEASPPFTATSALSKADSELHSWFQPKAWNDGLKQQGIAGNISFINDWSLLRSLRSSPPDSAERYLLDARVTLRTDQLLGWNGGVASIRLHHYFGDDGSERLGDAQGFSNIDDIPRNILYELWFQQTLLEGKVRMKFGKVDANTEFARVESAGNFLNSSMGYSPTILSLPTYPEPQPSANVFLRPGPYSFGFGLYRAGSGSALMLGEAGRGWNIGRLPGRGSFGLWHLSATLVDFDGDYSPGTHGYYAVLEQSLIRTQLASDSQRRLTAFLQYGSANERVSPFARHLGGGVVLAAPSRGRARDEIGAGASWAGFSGMPAAGFDYPGELFFESYYSLSVSGWAALVTDFQFVHHPGGRRDFPDALVVTPRLVVSF